MTIWDICIRRPVFTTMLVLGPVVLGLASYTRLGVELFPNVDVPVVVVTTTLKGASVEEMESSVTKPVEEVVNTVSGIDELRSTTREGVSTLVIGFKLEKNGDIAAQDVRDKISTLLPRLPVGTDPPVVEKFNLDAAPVITIAVSGGQGWKLREVTEIAKKLIKEDLEGVSGVGSVVLVGGETRAVNVTVNPAQLRARNLSVEDVRRALIAQNLELPGGKVDSGATEFGLRTIGRIQRPKDFEELIIDTRTARDGSKYTIRLKEVATVTDGVEEPRGKSRLDGNLAVSLVVQKQSGGNTVAVAAAVNARLAKIKTQLPPDIKLEVIRDQSKFIKGSIDEVKFHLVLAAFLVAGVIFIFIRDWRTTLIAATAVPTSIIGTFAFMDAMGFSLNNMTLLGLILAVGIVIDDAVVVLENVFRHMEEYGQSGRDAASSATKEIALAVLATTLSLVVIFAPIAFMSGQVGRFFNSFGFVVGFAILLSMVVSFTLTPMLCARFLKSPVALTPHPPSPVALTPQPPSPVALTPHPPSPVALTPQPPLPGGEGEQDLLPVALTPHPPLPGGEGERDLLPVALTPHPPLPGGEGEQDLLPVALTPQPPLPGGEGEQDLLPLSPGERGVGGEGYQIPGGEGEQDLLPLSPGERGVGGEGYQIPGGEGEQDLLPLSPGERGVGGEGHGQEGVGGEGHGQEGVGGEGHELGGEGHESGGESASKTGFLTRRYIGILGWSLRHRWVIMVATLLTFLSTPVLFVLVGTDFVPKDDQSEFEVALTLKEGTTLAEADARCTELEARLKEIRGVTNVFTTIGPTDGKAPKGQGDVAQVTIYCRMTDLRERDFHQLVAMADARKILEDYPDIRSAVQEVKLFSSSAFKNAQLDLSLRGPDSQKLEEYAAKVVKLMKANGTFTDVDTNATSRSPELQVRVDRDRAADQGVDVRGVATALLVLVGGEPVTKYKEGSDQFDVWLRADLRSRDRPSAVDELTVPTASGRLVELRTLATVTNERGPATVERYNRQRQIGVQCNLAPGIALGDATPEVEAYVKSLDLPPEYQYEFLGEAKIMADSNSNFAMAFLLAFVFMYMILAAQFESLVHPITILLAIPLTLPFALISLLILRTPLDVYATIGLFMLFGIVKKNGILQVDYTNVLRAKGLPRDEAILQANAARFRPILMTTIMLVAAMIPIATGRGPGAAARASMAKVILGGQLLSLLLSLLVTPVAYSLWDDFSSRFQKIAGWVGRRFGRVGSGAAVFPRPPGIKQTEESETIEVPPEEIPWHA